MYLFQSTFTQQNIWQGYVTEDVTAVEVIIFMDIAAKYLKP